MKSLRSLIRIVSFSAFPFPQLCCCRPVAGPAVPPGSSAAAVRTGRGPASLISRDKAADGRVMFTVYSPRASAVLVAADIAQGLN